MDAKEKIFFYILSDDRNITLENRVERNLAQIINLGDGVIFQSFNDKDRSSSFQGRNRWKIKNVGMDKNRKLWANRK